MHKYYSDLPPLINCITGKTLCADDLANPRVMVGAFEQMLHEVWRFAPINPVDKYQKYLPFDYVWHRLSIHLNDPTENIAHAALAKMLDQVFEHDRTSEITLSLRT